MKILAVILLCVSMAGCVRYVHPTMSQGQVNQVAFECKYKAEMMAQQYGGLYNVVAYANFLEQCMQAQGFVPAN